jgi:hypothetical protein
MASHNASRDVEANATETQLAAITGLRHTHATVQLGMLPDHMTYHILIYGPGENYGDPSGGLWSMYLTEAEERDKEKTERWKGDAEGILVFVSSSPYYHVTFLV